MKKLCPSNKCRTILCKRIRELREYCGYSLHKNWITKKKKKFSPEPRDREQRRWEIQGTMSELVYMIIYPILISHLKLNSPDKYGSQLHACALEHLFNTTNIESTCHKTPYTQDAASTLKILNTYSWTALHSPFSYKHTTPSHWMTYGPGQ